jgi:protein-disulfide isomerase
MPLRFSALAAVFALTLLTAVNVQAQDKPPAMTPQERGNVENVVREYLLANPEVIVEAIRIYREREQQAQEAKAREALAAHKGALLDGSDSPFAGNPKGDVTVVEFFDYHCGYCKRVFPLLQELLKTDKNLRWVFKEFPILGPESVTASRAALAAWQVDPAKYVAYHAALMQASGRLSEERVLKIAEGVGYDAGKLKKAMSSDPVEREINRNHQIAETLGIRGTPAFIVGNELVPGAIDIDTLRRLIAEARKG